MKNGNGNVCGVPVPDTSKENGAGRSDEIGYPPVENIVVGSVVFGILLTVSFFV